MHKISRPLFWLTKITHNRKDTGPKNPKSATLGLDLPIPFQRLLYLILSPNPKTSQQHPCPFSSLSSFSTATGSLFTNHFSHSHLYTALPFLLLPPRSSHSQFLGNPSLWALWKHSSPPPLQPTPSHCILSTSSRNAQILPNPVQIQLFYGFAFPF